MNNNNKCYAIGCDNNNIDFTCMYGNAKEMPCQVNCVRCLKGCKKENGFISCKKFEEKRSKL